ncbi:MULTISPECIES: phosphate acyltransferase PlsX [Sporomusa]|jgi:glycerol-3-phosphate acyltransferase PlsX|uniref:Phosphate acyltransferase n=2 Tax=Sporomusa TaxID=2375 RepID=A0ABM9VYD2_9FIRM|nr:MULTISPECIES: phosphate acyltransferase PlsX [Sporomusa]OLS58106.1 phosphate acyltransferase [Sporomusa sphaeroides DSM 2875]CVK17707.1 Phosphate acyltransferase [Sporomusa sphaeroides DSM 2875]SCM80515.1 Phosphate acyltransferase [uncultured Sporomusa sp.]HML31439.1 phosphate acyltransferase PlsX [Sporomusa sphaeroides]
MRVAIDAMGGDYAPDEIVLGALQAAKAYVNDDVEIVLVGDQSQITQALERHGNGKESNITVHHASEVIDMHESPGAAVRKKKDASVVVATSLVKQGHCDVVICAGSTGAAVAAALLGLGRINGIERPAIATPMPNLTGTTILLDSGANVDSKPKHLVQNAIMGAIYAEYVLNIPSPRVGLLTIGEEESKGNEQVLATYPLLKQLNTVNFIGNVEGRDIPKGTVDVVVCDGFVGNIVLKFGEGLAKAILQLIKESIKTSGFLTKVASMLVLPALNGLKKKLDYAEYGGAPLLGVNGGFIICHGSSQAKAIKNAIRVAKEFTEQDVVAHIRETIAKEGVVTHEGN